jgi:hypothetical protein
MCHVKMGPSHLIYHLALRYALARLEMLAAATRGFAAVFCSAKQCWSTNEYGIRSTMGLL